MIPIGKNSVVFGSEANGTVAFGMLISKHLANLTGQVVSHLLFRFGETKHLLGKFFPCKISQIPTGVDRAPKSLRIVLGKYAVDFSHGRGRRILLLCRRLFSTAR